MSWVQKGWEHFILERAGKRRSGWAPRDRDTSPDSTGLVNKKQRPPRLNMCMPVRGVCGGVYT